MVVGRGSELRELLSELRAAHARVARPVVVSGEAGIGKSELLQELAARAARSGFRVHAARCVEIGDAPAFWPWTQLLRGALDDAIAARLDSVAAEAVAVLAPDASTTALAEPGAVGALSGSATNRFRFFDAVVRVLEAMSEDGPRVFLVEHCHAADVASLQLLRFVASQTAGRASFLLVASYRDGAARPEAAALLADLAARAVRLPLQGLAAHHLAVLLAERLGHDVPGETVLALHEATGGNPLFATALAGHLARSGLLHSLSRGGGVPVPETVREVFEHRFSRLPPGVATGLAALAVAGREVDMQLARALLRDRCHPVLEAGLADGALEWTPSRSRIRFAHSLVQAGLVDRLPLAERERLHLRVATALEHRCGGELVPHLATLAHLFAHAGASGARKAFAYARAAGDEARRLGAVSDAAARYDQALEAAAAAQVGAKERADVLARRGRCRLQSGDVEAGEADCREAWEMAKRAGDAVVMAQAALAHATFQTGGLVNHETVRLVTGALAMIGPEHPGLRARLRARLAAELGPSAPLPAREALAFEAVEEARATKDPEVIWWTLRFADAAIATPDHVQTSIERTTEALEAAEAVDDLSAKAEVLALRSIHQLTLGRAGAWAADVSALEQLARQVPTPLNRWRATVLAGARALLDGRLDDAAQHAAALLQFAETVPDASLAWLAQTFTLEWDRGDVAVLAPAIASAMKARPDAGPCFRSVLTLVHAAAGRSEEANAVLPGLCREVVERRPSWGFLPSLGWLAEACSQLRNRDAARFLFEAMAPFADLHVVVPAGTAAAYLGSVHRYLANLAVVLGDVERAVPHAAAALDAHAAIGSAPYAARSQLDLASALLAGRRPEDRVRAHSLLADARATAERLGMSRLVEEVDVELERHRIPGRADADAADRHPRLVQEGEYWTLSKDGAVVRLRDSKGVRYLACLLGQPDREVHALDLAQAPLPDGARLECLGADEVLDDRARAAFRRRLRDLEEDLAEAESGADLGRAARLREEQDLLLEQLELATGLGGRARRLGANPAETARVAVTKALRAVLKKIEAADPELGRHFRATVRTGTFCSYASGIEACHQWKVRQQ